MIFKLKTIFLLFTTLFVVNIYSQSIQLFDQINGRYDFTYIGNTLNKNENGLGFPCEILTSSSANLLLAPNDSIAKAYLYWAGSGTGDFDVKINNIDIIAERNFSYNSETNNLDFFSAFADITQIVQNIGNGTYTFSELDLTSIIQNYCANGTNFGGWAILIIYKNDDLPLNQLNIYDGLEAVPEEINIELLNLNVIDNIGAKVGFIAWEGDRSIAINETLSFNGNLLSNSPLNPVFNAFNGTNSITNSNVLYNMDLDIYQIQNFIQIGDQSANITLTSSQDLVMVNNVITKLNSQIPDASVVFNNIEMSCNSRDMKMNFDITNFNSTDLLPANTTVKIYADDILLHEFTTETDILINDSINYNYTTSLPANIPLNFTLKIIVDEANIITEILENNNAYTQNISLLVSTNYPDIPTITTCNLGFRKGKFDLADIFPTHYTPFPIQYSIHQSISDAEQNFNEITIAEYEVSGFENYLYVRLVNEFECVTILPLKLELQNCPPEIFNAISVNNDNLNDELIITGLYNIFENYNIEIYSRWGQKIWEGNSHEHLWNGDTKNGKAPAGTYYYILKLNDPKYPNALQGYLYLTY